MDIQEPKRQKALFLHYAGADFDEIFDTLTIPDPVGEQTIYDVTVSALTDYFTHRVNAAFEVYNFRQCQQKEGKQIDSYTTRFRQLARSCNFADVDSEIVNQIILVGNSQNLRTRELRQEMSLTEPIAAARALEVSEYQAGQVELASTSIIVNVIDPAQRKPFTIESRNGNMVTATKGSVRITRSVIFFKRNDLVTYEDLDNMQLYRK
ncbi:hypothetical protein LSH36_735g01076 [Paralvinella palmiformis]|uniref:Retrotransposon gag domain-containing protein n=1 Tax=Paralvinella palmiformis TaxID=53620 RepID=A0AAD9J1Q7_9ANNE|nr:hypothetical protein LSH36_735g01076 [Paralvinella palmiformis]